MHEFRRCVNRYRGNYSENTVKTQIWIAISIYQLLPEFDYTTQDDDSYKQLILFDL